MSRKERLAWIALIGLALVLRLVALGDRPPHTTGHPLRLCVQPSHQGTYRYDPTYHGPLILTSWRRLSLILGASTASAGCTRRLPVWRWWPSPSCCAAASGRAAWWSGLILAISPIMLYYSRFAREDVPVAFFTALALTLFLLVRKKGWRLIPWIGVAAAGHAMMKETFYVTVPRWRFHVFVDVAGRSG